MTYGEMPPDPNYTVPEDDKNRVLYCCVPIFGCNVMFSDCASDMSLIKGNNFAPTIGTKDTQEIHRIFNELKGSGEVLMDLQKTFWSELYGMVQDKYDIIWQLGYEQ
jgi:PhnB protein